MTCELLPVTCFLAVFVYQNRFAVNTPVLHHRDTIIFMGCIHSDKVTGQTHRQSKKGTQEPSDLQIISKKHGN